MFRIMNDAVKAGAKAPAIFFQHGLFETGDCWLAHGPELAPAFQFARAGYDVYLGNNRGNMYSNKNTHLSPTTDSKAFHDYSFEEYGKYDLPTQIDEARRLSGQDKVTYVGHSQGTTQMFYALVKDQAAIMSKVNLFVALAPIARMASVTGSLEKIGQNIDFVDIGLNLTHQWEIFSAGQKEFINSFGSETADKSPFQALVLAVSGSKDPSKSHSDPTSSLILHKNFPQATSTKSLVHLGQLIGHKKFIEFDYGWSGNYKHYHSHTEPELVLSKITQMPTALFAGVDDTLATVKDVAWLKTQLGHVAHYEVVQNMGHGFQTAKDMSYMTNFMNVVKQYNPVPAELENLALY